MSLPKIKDWHVETLRLTLFGLEPISAVGRGWWKAVTGQEAEATLNKQSSGEYSESGEFFGGQFELKISLNRVDWVLSYPFSDFPGSPRPEDIEQLAAKWLQSFDKWFKLVDFSIARVALGAVGLCKVPDIVSGNRIISDYLHFVHINDTHNISDLMVQVNFPSVFRSVDNLRHNRIVKMGVLERQVITIGPAGFPTAVADTVVRAELDMSSAVRPQGLISAESLKDLSSEMSDALVVILREGVEHDKA